MITDIISAASNFAAAALSAREAAENTDKAPAPGAEKDMFMKLLVAQLKHQDPLAPQDGTAFVTQLAQFNSLDQLIGIRNAIEGLAKTAAGGSEAKGTQTEKS